MIKVGIWIPEKRIKTLHLNDAFKNKLKDINFILIDLDKPIEIQGPFHIIIHRILDLAFKEDDISERRFKNFKSYVNEHPEIPICDDIQLQIGFRFRAIQIKINEKCANSPDLMDRTFVPPWTILETNDPNDALKLLKNNNLQFPIICKSMLGQADYSAHNMCIIFNKESISQLKVPCIAQSFVNHNAKLRKIYTMGPFSFVFERESISNLYAGDTELKRFHTDDLANGNLNSSFPPQLNMEETFHEPDVKFMQTIGQVCRRYSGLDFFGVDIIIDNESGKYAIIDMNPFPSYTEINFLDNLIEFVKWRLNLS